MDQIDQLGWLAGLSIESHGVRVGIRTNDPGWLERLRDRLPPGARPLAPGEVDVLYSFLAGGAAAGRVRRYNLVYAGPTRVARTLDLEAATDALETDLHFRIASTAPGRIFVHAGVVDWRGRAIVIPGRSGAGKTTLVRALIEAGAGYYSDEYAVLDARGRVHPYPKALSIRHDGVERAERRHAETLDARVGVAPLRVGVVVMTKYTPGARWRPRVLSEAEGLMALLSHTVLARTRTDRVLRVLRRAVDGATCLASARGEARTVVDSLLERSVDGTSRRTKGDETAGTKHRHSRAGSRRRAGGVRPGSAPRASAEPHGRRRLAQL